MKSPWSSIINSRLALSVHHLMKSDVVIFDALSRNSAVLDLIIEYYDINAVYKPLSRLLQECYRPPKIKIHSMDVMSTKTAFNNGLGSSLVGLDIENDFGIGQITIAAPPLIPFHNINDLPSKFFASSDSMDLHHFYNPYNPYEQHFSLLGNVSPFVLDYNSRLFSGHREYSFTFWDPLSPYESYLINGTLRAMECKLNRNHIPLPNNINYLTVHCVDSLTGQSTCLECRTPVFISVRVGFYKQSPYSSLDCQSQIIPQPP